MNYVKTIGVSEKIEEMHRTRKNNISLTCRKCLKLVLKNLLMLNTFTQ